MDNTKTGAEEIVAERERQIEVKGFDAKNDIMHLPTDLLEAGLCYLRFARLQLELASTRYVASKKVDGAWPWDDSWWKPSDDPQRNMAKGGALVAAAMDRAKAV